MFLLLVKGSQYNSFNCVTENRQKPQKTIKYSESMALTVTFWNEYRDEKL